MTDKRSSEIYKVTLIGFLINMVLTIAKLLAGFFGRSGAMIADGIHSLSDFMTDLVVLFFVRLSSKPEDEDHDYGHGKYETLATIIIGVLLVAVAVGIFYNSVSKIMDIRRGVIDTSPGAVALVAAAVSIVVKELLYRYTYKVGKKVNSPAVMANAWHHRSDALSSIATLIGIGGAFFIGGKWAILDPIAAIVVSVLILKVAYDLVVPGVGELLEVSLPADVEKHIEDIVLCDAEVRNVHNMKTRRIGRTIAVEFHILLDPMMSVAESHAVTQKIEDRLTAEFGPDILISIHVEPDDL